MTPKPSGCFDACPYARVGTGFVPCDSLEKAPSALIAVVLDAPGKYDAHEGKGLVSHAGRKFFNEFVSAAGYARPDVLIDHLIRCYPRGGSYPLRDVAAPAEAACRQWDAGLNAFEPDLAIPTFSPSDIQREPTKTRLLGEAVKKAFRWAGRGRRPVLLCGERVVKHYLPGLPVTQEWFRKPFMATWQGSVHELRKTA